MTVHAEDTFGRGQFISFSMRITGLEDGRYAVYYYQNHVAWRSGMTINGMPMEPLAGASSDALGPRGSNWDLATGVAVSGGVLTIIDEQDGDVDGLSGLQLVHLPEPTTP